MKKISIKYYVLSILGLAVFAYYIIHATNYQLPPALAQTAACPTQSSNPRVTDGLISASSISDNKFSNNTGTCVVDPNKAPFVPYKIPTYDDLKSLYYTQAKTITGVVVKVPSPASLPISLTDNKLYYFTGDLTISSPSNITQTQTGIIFVEGNLTIGPISSNKLTGNYSGLVFVVKGDVNIDKDVTQIDAVIIAEGTICTAYTGGSCMDGTTVTPQLIINGSLISLKESNPIQFKRYLANNSTTPAEKINYQPKYLVILRNLFSDTLQKWSEIQ